MMLNRLPHGGKIGIELGHGMQVKGDPDVSIPVSKEIHGSERWVRDQRAKFNPFHQNGQRDSLCASVATIIDGPRRLHVRLFVKVGVFSKTTNRGEVAQHGYS